MFGKLLNPFLKCLNFCLVCHATVLLTFRMNFLPQSSVSSHPVKKIMLRNTCEMFPLETKQSGGKLLPHSFHLRGGRVSRGSITQQAPPRV
jgi:hypothetical protein